MKKLIVGFIYLVARLARQWIEREIIDMRVRANEPNEPRLVWCMVKSGPVFCSLAQMEQRYCYSTVLLLEDL